METLEKAASRLAQRLRGCPSDGILERLEQHADRADALREQLGRDWASCRTAVEALIDEVIAERARVYDGAIAFLDTLGRLTRRVTAVLDGLSPALEEAGHGLARPGARGKAMQDGIAASVELWASQGAQAVAGLVDREGQNLMEMHRGIVKAIRGILLPEVEKRKDLAQGFGKQAAQIAPTAIKVLDACYEEWCVRLATMTGLADRHARHEITDHGKVTVEAALTEGRDAQSESFEEVVLMLQSARQRIDALTTDAQGVNEGAGEAMREIDTAVTALGEALGSGTDELAAAESRLSVYTTGMLL